jgi:hypothetical protein
LVVDEEVKRNDTTETDGTIYPSTQRQCTKEFTGNVSRRKSIMIVMVVALASSEWLQTDIEARSHKHLPSFFSYSNRGSASLLYVTIYPNKEYEERDVVSLQVSKVIGWAS